MIELKVLMNGWRKRITGRTKRKGETGSPGPAGPCLLRAKYTLKVFRGQCYTEWDMLETK